MERSKAPSARSDRNENWKGGLCGFGTLDGTPLPPETTSVHPLLLSCFAVLVLFLPTEARAEKNVLLLIVDDLRPELGAYGSEVLTPNMDKLADEGVLFERAYCNSAVCGASRASLMTGIRPGRHRFLRYDTWAEKDAPGAISMPQVFKDAGYQTVSYGKVFHHWKDHQGSWDEIKSPKTKSSWRDYLLPENIEKDRAKGQRGPAYEIYEGEEAYKDEGIADLAIEKLKQLAETKQPFFLAAGFVKPHLPFNAPKKYWDLYEPEQIDVPATYERITGIPDAAYHNSGELRHYGGVPEDKILPEDYARKLIHGYYAATSFVDAQVGRVLDELDRLGLRDETIVVLIGDHGYNLGEHTLWCKHTNFDHAMRTPMIIDAPGSASGQKTEALAEYVDLFPTLTELANLNAPANQLEGKSLVPVLEDPNQSVKDGIVSKYQDGVSLRTDRYLYTEFQDRKSGDLEARMLFDLEEDPLETRNLADDPAFRETVQDLQQQLYASWGDNFEKRPGE